MLFYPAGRHTGQGYEKVYNKTGAWYLASNLPEGVRIYGVRVRGLWGSIWSNAWTGKSSRLFKNYFRGMGIIFGNLLFFVPKRKIIIDIVDITDEAIKKSQEGLKNFNTYLENFYNKYGEEKVLYQKHFFFMPKYNKELPKSIENSFEEWQKISKINEAQVPDEIFEKVKEIIVDELDLNPKDVHLNANLVLDLGVDSISLVNIVNTAETEIESAVTVELDGLKTVGDICYALMGKYVPSEELKPTKIFEQIKPPVRAGCDPDDTIVSAFIKSFTKNKKEIYCYDSLLGDSTRKDYLLKAMVLSNIIKQNVKEEYLGIMLPATQSTSLLIMASYFAGKIPVMFNWTLGSRGLNHCLDIKDVSTILTAEKFFKKVEEGLPDRIKEKCLFIEKKILSAGLGVKLSGLWKSIFIPKFKHKPEDVAVVLFTSGSESLPKGVPLTHKNIIRNVHISVNHEKMTTDAIIVSALPQFHSFGFTVGTVIPWVSNMKVVYSPDPTDSRELIRIIRHTRANTSPMTPTFLRMLLQSAEKDDLKTIRLMFTAAESLQPKTVEAFYNKAAEGAKIIEGYGITECSPVLTLNPRDLQKIKSVGIFMPNVKYKLVNPESFKEVELGEEGLILVHGPNVFNGYLGESVEDPFVTIDGIKYYNTGDIARQDEDGFLYITGRLKRFIKIGGEMISLQSIESALVEEYGTGDEVTFAIDGTDEGDKPEVILYSKYEFDLKEVNEVLKNKGFSPLVKVNRIEMVQEIPLLGTGKTDYKNLKYINADQEMAIQ